MRSVYLPRFTYGPDAYDAFGTILKQSGTKAAIFHGEKAWKAAGKQVLEACKEAGIEVVVEALYGGEATIENAEALTKTPGVEDVDFILGVGGGKCLDTVKYAGNLLNKPVYTCASIASTCAAVTKISIMYHADGSFREITQLKEPPVHCFIQTDIIAAAPIQYLWAGMGDTMAKHVESVFSAKADHDLEYPSALGIKIGDLCFDGILEYGPQAYEDAKAHRNSNAFEQTVLNILISTGSVSVSVDPNYNSALAHALFYGLTVRESIEKEHLHGEVVSYGTLVQLCMDGQLEMLKKAYDFNRQLKLPTCLEDLGLDIHSDLSDVLKTAEANQELKHVPYPVTAEKILESMKKLEEYDKKEKANG